MIQNELVIECFGRSTILFDREERSERVEQETMKYKDKHFAQTFIDKLNNNDFGSVIKSQSLLF
jgi:hypothetical protein